MGIKQMPSASRLRQRFDEDVTQLLPLIEDSLPEVFLNYKAPITPPPEKLDKIQHIRLDMDVSPWTTARPKRKRWSGPINQWH